MTERKIVEYGLIQSEDYNKFYDMVNNRIKLGWQPLGGISTLRDNLYIVFTQAMVRYD